MCFIPQHSNTTIPFALACAIDVVGRDQLHLSSSLISFLQFEAQEYVLWRGRLWINPNSSEEVRLSVVYACRIDFSNSSYFWFEKYLTAREVVEMLEVGEVPFSHKTHTCSQEWWRGESKFLPTNISISSIHWITVTGISKVLTSNNHKILELPQDSSPAIPPWWIKCISNDSLMT